MLWDDKILTHIHNYTRNHELHLFHATWSTGYLESAIFDVGVVTDASGGTNDESSQIDTNDEIVRNINE